MSDTTNRSNEPEERRAETRLRTLPVLPIRGNTVLYPYIVIPLAVGRERSLQAVDEALKRDKHLLVVAQRDQDEEDPGPSGLYTVGVAVTIYRTIKQSENTIHVIVQGAERVHVEQFVREEPYLEASIRTIEEEIETSDEVTALCKGISSQFQKLVSIAPHMSDELRGHILNLESEPSKLADLIAFGLSVQAKEKQDLLETLDVKERLKKLTVLLNREILYLEVSNKIQNDVQSEMGKLQREHYLREQKKAIERELGEGDDRAMEIDELRNKIEASGMSEEARKEADRELGRLAKMPPQAAEYTVSRTYLDWLVNLPWNVSTEDNLDIEAARQVLDEDHYGLEKIKDRVLEYLAVRKLKADMKGPILCFVGPPGVGKTSLGRSIARALGRKFVRISLGGVRDEAEIRGHRRTYIGSLPGRIIQSIRKAESNNPLFMLDEVDKLGADFRGDPSAALLEVLDPEQNFSFSDHYLDVPFDLSKVMFITTANVLATIPPALKDRMEVIELHGYTEEEKVGIAKAHLIPRQLDAHGLEKDLLSFSDGALQHIIRDYTREAGVRNLEREIGTISRKIARKIAEGEKGPFRVKANQLHTHLGPVRFFSEVAERTGEPGVTTGLAWTPNGGDILFVEATKMRGKKELILTGQLGDVMRESAQAALSYVRSRAGDLGIDETVFEQHDIHIHVPAGAIPKDGPSAGVTIATALVSLLTGAPPRWDVAMTGEITLRGKVLPVGGIKEKVLAAQRAGIHTVVLPKRNEKDLEDVPEKIRNRMAFRFVESIDQAIWIALGKATQRNAA